jgi:hypothetical protein
MKKTRTSTAGSKAFVEAAKSQSGGISAIKDSNDEDLISSGSTIARAVARHVNDSSGSNQQHRRSSAFKRDRGPQIAAPPWSIACMTDHGPSECGEPCGFTVAAARSHGTGMRSDASSSFCPCPFRVLCHEQRRSKRRCVTARKMKESPSGSAIRSLIPSHRELLRSKAVVVSVAETHGQSSRQAIAPSMSGRAGRELPKGRARAWTNKTPPRRIVQRPESKLTIAFVDRRRLRPDPGKLGLRFNSAHERAQYRSSFQMSRDPLSSLCRVVVTTRAPF